MVFILITDHKRNTWLYRILVNGKAKLDKNHSNLYLISNILGQDTLIDIKKMRSYKELSERI